MAPETTSAYIRSFNQVTAADVPLVGGKGANLGEMTRAGLPVPPGFCLTAEAYRTCIRESGLEQQILACLEGIRPEDPAQVEARTGEIRRLICEQPFPAEIQAQTLAAYHALAQELALSSADLRVAVRSSATAEDLPDASFAGQQDTYLNIQGEAALLDHIRRCWASLWTARAVSYRIKQGYDHRQVALCAIVQAMIPSEVAGVMFTANPVTGNRGEEVINASWGLGEAIVSGLVTPDTVMLSKNGGTIISKQIAEKERQVEYAPGGGTVEVEIPVEARTRPALSDEQLRELAAIGQQIETHYGRPQDIEWAYANGRFYVLQARAITTLKEAAAALPGEYNRTMFRELFPDPLSPIFLSVIRTLFRRMLDFTFETWGFRPPAWPTETAVGAFYNQPYFSRDYIAEAFAPLSPQVREQLVTQIVNPFGRHAHTLPTELSSAFLSMVLRLLRFMTSFPKQLPGVVGEYRAELAASAALPLDNLSDVQIVDRIEHIVYGTAARLLNYDFLMIATIGLTYQALGTLLEHEYEDSAELRARLISGVTGNVTMETNKRMWELAQTAKRSPAVVAIFRQYPDSEIPGQLDKTPEAREFLDEFGRFLAEFGHREYKMDILYPTWGEDPAPVLSFIRAYFDADENASPLKQETRLVREREEAARRVHAQLNQGVRGRLFTWPLFHWVLQQSQGHTRERDTLHFELTRLFPPFRHMLTELGRRWTARGRLDRPDDLYYLTFDEVCEAATAALPLQDRIRPRRAEFEANRRRAWPPIIRDGEEIWTAAEEPARGAGDGRHWVGVAGSPGVQSGVARVICGPEEFGKLQRGEILVAPLTNPVWTPLFAIAGAVVTEVGGILSHGAIVAREYGIPAVMSVTGATSLIRDGQTLTVDGNKGVVSL